MEYVIREFRNNENPTNIDDNTAIYVFKGRKCLKDFKISFHKSHKMTK